jgi:hypothetical protein
MLSSSVSSTHSSTLVRDTARAIFLISITICSTYRSTKAACFDNALLQGQYSIELRNAYTGMRCSSVLND